MAPPYLSRDSSRPVVVGVVVIATLYFARVVVIPLALAILFTFVLAPLVQLLERALLGRAVSSLLVVAIAAVAVSAVGWTVTKQFADVVNQLPNYQANIKEKIDSLHWSKSQTLNNASATMNQIGNELAAPPASPGQRAATEKQAGKSASASQRRPLPVEVVQPPSLPLESVQNVLTLLGTALIVVVFTIFMLMRREDLRNRFISLVGQGN
jgi:predicted PurR-regulated permease PerM